MNEESKIIVITGPSGAGKSSTARELAKAFPQLGSAVSDTNREKGAGEEDGKDYNFLASAGDFLRKYQNGEYAECQEVYPGTWYGTTKKELERIMVTEGKSVLLEIDVFGAQNIKKIYGEKAFIILIAPPSMEELKRRLLERKRDTPEVVDCRVAKGELELETAETFCDARVTNRIFEITRDTVKDLAGAFLGSGKVA